MGTPRPKYRTWSGIHALLCLKTLPPEPGSIAHLAEPKNAYAPQRREISGEPFCDCSHPMVDWTDLSSLISFHKKYGGVFSVKGRTLVDDDVTLGPQMSDAALQHVAYCHVSCRVARLDARGSCRMIRAMGEDHPARLNGSQSAHFTTGSRALKTSVGATGLEPATFWSQTYHWLDKSDRLFRRPFSDGLYYRSVSTAFFWTVLEALNCCQGKSRLRAIKPCAMSEAEYRNGFTNGRPTFPRNV